MAIAAENEIQFYFVSTVDEILPGARIIKLRGYTRNNKDYPTAKKPVGEWSDSPTMTDTEIQNWINQGGWIGAVIPQNMILVDIDDSIQGELVKGLLEGENVHHHCIKTPNGWQFVFTAKKEKTKEVKQIAKWFSQIGVVIDTRTAEAGYIVFPTENTEGRYIVTNSLNQLDELPHYLKPIRNTKLVKDKTTNEKYVFSIPIEEAGSRNDTLYNFASHLKVWKVDPEEIRKAMELIYEYFLLDKKNFPFSELKNLVQSAVKWKPDPPSFQLTLETENDGFVPQEQQEIIPLPFHIKGDWLYKTIIKKERGEEYEVEVFVCRMIPKILKELSNVERNSKHYEISWRDRGKRKSEIVSAGTLSTKKELLTLADKGFAVTDLNYRDLIDYFDRFLSFNHLNQSLMVERLGHIKSAFIHPLNSEGIEIVPNDIGERQLLEAFQIAGTAETWKAEVFDRIKNHKKALFLVLSSFASILLHDLKVTPFIVDLSGSTSQGKTTALEVARSVWGTKGLISEWNSTKVSIERKTAFLNSFPLYMDDTRKANEKDLQSIVYQFSGGRSKGRGSVKGSQIEATWNNILISTGEVSLSDYAKKAGGAAARVITIVDQPFENVNETFFTELYTALESNFGAVGMEFLTKWQTKKKDLLPEFHNFKNHYLKKSKGNEVLSRLSMYYAAVHFAGSVAMKTLNLEMDLKLLDRLFDEIAGENKALDKPKELLEQILIDLDADRESIFYDYAPRKGIIKAVFKDEILYLTPAYLKDILGPEIAMVRREWRKKHYTFEFDHKGKIVDYKQLKHCGKNFQVVPLSKEIVAELGFDFEITV